VACLQVSRPRTLPSSALFSLGATQGSEDPEGIRELAIGRAGRPMAVFHRIVSSSRIFAVDGLRVSIVGFTSSRLMMARWDTLSLYDFHFFYQANYRLTMIKWQCARIIHSIVLKKKSVPACCRSWFPAEAELQGAMALLCWVYTFSSFLAR
jgi:hypothetical protein